MKARAEVDTDQIIAEVAADYGLGWADPPQYVVDVGVHVLHDAMPLLKRDAFPTGSLWLRIFTQAFIEWARAEHHRTTAGQKTAP
ncbi:hypothetical protein [Prauserella muralis]|uniref:Uncharacterized protein n=1 Tax=Prauserella muralis TaxID=588067 RepID=A0A2V4AXQ2_9PSEU|nr:hypothetical protein [Prauserella muralis]PXY25444.1 hypothetical protein BAY60_18900 [Prauserella muralis]TWE27567.1 hypothetical protein FHX69_0203 [Prauserella muralis]